MRLNRLSDCKGVSLVEVMISLVVLLLVFVGLFQSALLGIDNNMRNLLRDEAVMIAAARMEEARNMPFDSVVSDTAPLGEVDCPNDFTVGKRLQKNLRNITKDFCVELTCWDEENKKDCTAAETTCNTKRIRVRVGWTWKSEPYTHSATTLRRR